MAGISAGSAGGSGSTRYLLFFRAILLGNLLLAAMYAPEAGKAWDWIRGVFPAYAACALALYGLERRVGWTRAAARWSFLLDVGFAASAAYALPGDSMGLFIAFFLVILSSTLLREPVFSILLAGVVCAVYTGASQPGAAAAADPGRLMKLALLAGIALFSVFMAAYAQQIERSIAEPYELRIAWLERLSLVGRALRGILHEVKTPLGTILLSVENLRGMLRRGEDVEAELVVIAGEAERASQILDNFLEFTRPVDIALEPLSLSAPIEKVLAAMRGRLEERDIRLEPDLDPTTRVLGSERHLVQAFTNLFMNAIQAMPSGGMLSVRQARSGGMACVFIRDTGRGMEGVARADLSDADPESQPDARGFGLGLGIVRWIVQKHGGGFSLESPGPGRGATALLRLPLLPEN